MIDFGGWEMPVSYTDIMSEHRAVREGVGLFDLAHMGRLAISGPDADTLVQRSQTNDVDRIKVGQIRYAMFLNERGGVIDDILVHRRPSDLFLVVNASRREVDLARLKELSEGLDVVIDDQSENLGMLAIQGPKSPEVVSRLVEDIDVDGLGYYRLAEGRILGEAGMITRTGYTGEDGFELYLPASSLVDLWDAALEQGAPEGLRPCGLGARDTLRLEAGMPLYGHEITEDVNPVEAGLMFGVRLKKPDYPGKDVIARVKAEGPKRRIVGLAVEGRRIPRQGYTVLSGEAEVGRIASGSWSPTFERAIATALVAAEVSDVGRELTIDIRGRTATARVVALPFYKRDGSGSLNTTDS